MLLLHFAFDWSRELATSFGLIRRKTEDICVPHLCDSIILLHFASLPLDQSNGNLRPVVFRSLARLNGFTLLHFLIGRGHSHQPLDQLYGKLYQVVSWLLNCFTVFHFLMFFLRSSLSRILPLDCTYLLDIRNFCSL